MQHHISEDPNPQLHLYENLMYLHVQCKMAERQGYGLAFRKYQDIQGCF
jgi:hypothetical protein